MEGFDVAFECVGKRSSFQSRRGGGVSVGTIRHSTGFVCSITGATCRRASLAVHYHSMVAVCACVCARAFVSLCTEHPGTSTDRYGCASLLFFFFVLERGRIHCLIPGGSSAVFSFFFLEIIFEDVVYFYFFLSMISIFLYLVMYMTLTRH